MKGAKRKTLEAAGWQPGTAGQLLGLSKREAELVELTLALATVSVRDGRKLTQARLAKLIHVKTQAPVGTGKLPTEPCLDDARLC